MAEMVKEPVLRDGQLWEQWHEDERLQEAHERLALVKLDKFWGDMPLPSHPTGGDRTHAEYVELSHSSAERNRAIVLPLPFANGWAPHMALRAKLLLDSLDEPTRLIVFPNDRNSYHLDKAECQQVAHGNFEPIAVRQFRTLDQQGINEFRYIGYSQGASIGAAALKLAAYTGYFGIDHSGLFEAPNVIGRTPLELTRLFIQSGKGLNKAVNDSAIPALSEAQASRGGFDVLKQKVGMAKVAVASQSKINRAIHHGFSYPTFDHDIATALAKETDLNILVASAKESTIFPIDVMNDLCDVHLMHGDTGLRTLVVEGYGHEMGDNIVAHTILAKLALKAA